VGLACAYLTRTGVLSLSYLPMVSGRPYSVGFRVEDGIRRIEIEQRLQQVGYSEKGMYTQHGPGRSDCREIICWILRTSCDRFASRKLDKYHRLDFSPHSGFRLNSKCPLTLLRGLPCLDISARQT